MKKNIKERDYYFDNLRFIFILLVVIAHFISPLSYIYGIKVIYRYIYLFHMPGMIFISGYFAKSAVKDGKLVKNKIFNFVLLYTIFQIIFTFMIVGKFSIYRSQFGLWYLQILIIYLLLLPMISRLKAAPVLILSLILGLLVGFDNSAGHVASLQRVLVFLPFYMVGYYCNRDNINKVLKTRYIVFGIIFMLAIGFIQYKYLNMFPWSLNLSASKLSYNGIGLTWSMGVISRFIWYIIASLMIISLMAITPRNKTVFSVFGGRTLQVFLLHLPLVVLLRKTNLLPWIGHFEPIYAIIIAILFSVLMTVILSLKIFSYPFDYIMNLKFKRLLKGD